MNFGKHKVILASKSPRRKELLRYITKDFEILVSNADESSEKTEPDKLVEELSFKKAEAVADRVKAPAIVIGADTIVYADGNILGKPTDEDDAKAMIRKLSGKVHQVFTGVTVIKKDEDTVVYKTFSVKSDVYVAEMTEDEIDEYVAEGECLDKAGAYAIQGSFCRFIYKFEGDYSNIVGLPVAATYAILQNLMGLADATDVEKMTYVAEQDKSL